MNVISTLRANALKLLCVVLVTLLVALKVQYNDTVDKLDSATTSLTIKEETNKRLIKENEKLVEELKTKPKEIIKTVKEVQRELCHIQSKVDSIDKLPARNKEVTDEKETVDIDSRLPDDLIRLLQQATRGDL